VVKLAVMAEVRSHFRPEFINRIDEIVVFHGLDEKNIGAIARSSWRRWSNAWASWKSA
jgi:ATP-dependent Clp protease ATP-binding subunit ClpB